MNGPDAPATTRNLWRRMLIAGTIGAPIGGVAGYFVGRALKRGSIVALLDWTLADLFSLLIALTLLISAGYAAWATTSRKRWNEMVEKQPVDTEVDPAALVEGRRGALVAALGGLLIMVPPIAAHAGLGTEMRSVVALALGALLLVECLINWKMWKDGDELARAVIAQTGALCFWVLQLGLFIWAALARLDLVAEVDSWTLMTILMGAYLVTSVTISVRRGLVNV
ncbi:MAG: hypothetical protein K2W86_08430 [Sphingomonas sp.]|uniref:hypothetical protein n=1 Tax=Sphingomonas sp. TaxID=28214 RepID=UPI0035A86D38|nr:hypothetical protein [Sphingomonas sp.]